MTPEEKWKRLKSPQSAEDYGLVLTEAEIQSFPEGCAVLADLGGYSSALDDQTRTVMEALGNNAANAVEQVRHGVLMGKALPPNKHLTDEQIAESIARRVMRVETLAVSNMDALDFHEVSVTEIKRALLEALAAGRAAAK